MTKFRFNGRQKASDGKLRHGDDDGFYRLAAAIIAPRRFERGSYLGECECIQSGELFVVVDFAYHDGEHWTQIEADNGRKSWRLDKGLKHGTC